MAGASPLQRLQSVTNSKILSGKQERSRSSMRALKSPEFEAQATRSPLHSRTRDLNGVEGMEDPDGIWASIAQFIEHFQAHTSTAIEKELATKGLLDLAKSGKDAKNAIGSHSQAIPLLVTLLRSGTTVAKVNAALTLGILCDEEELRVKVLLGGCIPPLLGLLRSGSAEAKKAAAKAIYAVSHGGVAAEHIGMKIFMTEGVIPSLWEQLHPRQKQEKVVNGHLTGALRNLCNNTESFLQATLQAGGVDILVRLITSDSVVAQSNASSLLASLMLASETSCTKVLNSGAIQHLLKLVGTENAISARAEAAGALQALSSKLKSARKAMVDAGSVPILISAVVAPSKEFMQGQSAQALQENAMGALANISGGMSAIVLSLGENIETFRSDSQVADILGALAYALMVFKSDPAGSLDTVKIERLLVKQLRPRISQLVQERAIEALASLYGNAHLSVGLINAEAKKLLVGLVTMAGSEVQDDLIHLLRSLCSADLDLWHSLREREGIQILISFLGLSTEQQQEHSVALLSILTVVVDESKWAITAAGGIPPLVQLLETGSRKAKEDAAIILGNLCAHSEEICACVESADAVPALLWLLRNGSSKGQEIAANTLKHLIRDANAATVNQLVALLLGNQPKSKVHVITTLGCLLSVASHEELVQKGCAANKGLQSLVQMVSSLNEETKEAAASVLADIFAVRKDLCENLGILEIIDPLIRLLSMETECIAMQSARALAALFSAINSNKHVANVAGSAVMPLIQLAKSPSISAAEMAINALANLFLDVRFAEQAMVEDVIPSLTRVLKDGTKVGQEHAAGALARLLTHMPVDDVLVETIHHCGTVISLIDFLASADLEDVISSDALEALAIMAREKQGGTSSIPPWAILAELPHSLEPLVKCLAIGLPPVQEKAIEVLSRLCRDQPVVLGDLLAGTCTCIYALAGRVIHSDNLEVKVGGTALLICAAKEHRQRTLAALNESGFFIQLICSLVHMLKQATEINDLRINKVNNVYEGQERHFEGGDTFSMDDRASILGGTVALWLLSIISSYDDESKVAIMEAGAIEVLTEKLTNFSPSALQFQMELEDGGGMWVSALLLAILFQHRDVIRAGATMRAIPSLSNLLRSDEAIDRYFAAQALASLVCNGSRGTLLAVANSGAAGGLISLLGCVELNISTLDALSEEFSLVHNPVQVVLERLFRVDDIRVGATARKSIPSLVELLKPMSDRPGASALALALLTEIAQANNANKVTMAEAGALDALAKYLSLGPQDVIEEAATNLVRILFSSPDLRQYDSAIGTVTQLIAVLQLGSRGARYNAARALQGLFESENMKNADVARQAIKPLVEMLSVGSEKEQQAAIGALIKLSYQNPSKALTIADAEVNPIESLYRILASPCSLELKEDAALLCSILFANSRVRATSAASSCIQPLVELLTIDSNPIQEASARALDNLLDDEQQAEVVAAYGTVNSLVGLVGGTNYPLLETAISALVKLGKDRPPCKIDMVKAGVIDNVLEILPDSPDSLCSLIAELICILTNNSSIAKSAAGARVVEPLFQCLTRPDLSTWGQHRALQALVNILEKPQSLANLRLTPSLAIEPLLIFLESPSHSVKQLGAELLSHLVAQEYFQRDITTQQAVVPLVQLAGLGISNLQEKAIKALESASASWPNSIADAGGIIELSKVLLQVDPQPSHALWESAALVLSNVLRFSSQYYLKVPLAVLVKLLRSSSEQTVVVSLSALLVLERDDASSAELMAECGAVEALLELLRSHQSEESAARLLEALFNNSKVRDMKVSKYAIAPLSQYLLDPQTQAQPARLLATLALGDIFQSDGLARTTDAVSACRALVSLLEDQPNEEMTMVAICALQNLVMHSRTNRRAVAEAGGILVVQEILSSNNSEMAGQAALLIKFLFSNHTLQEYVSSELVRALTGALEKEFWATATINEEIVKAIYTLFSNFSRLRGSEAATLCIPHLVGALKAGTEPAQEAALDAICLLKDSWPSIPAESGRAQAMVAAEAIPILQLLIRSSPPHFQEKADSLLQCLPGSLTVTIKRGYNLKQSIGNTSAFCKLTLGNGPPRQTKVVSRSISPEWKQSFAWAFDMPPKGQKLQISCKTKNTFGKGSLGKVTIQIDKVVMLGTISGQYKLVPDANRDGTSRMLEIEFQWSNR
ncbi:protein CELLULOSE SYNTHASE INTERACTIVE 1 isoform X1 [Cryptomeria japonica]|uniref:protein CELLULOSE SYNTHASE INTERACTIVE 1 isoform X1 n=2 Tax=Cryptomeria japonica TaxID=3369 RepID=UPI0027DA696C|nr:protein CELLULOSE SYNTHASE INTERACTIVE 1 isoform X1 [Cryptomeria japonica]